MRRERWRRNRRNRCLSDDGHAVLLFWIKKEVVRDGAEDRVIV